MMNSKTGIIFDVDGTLWDSAKYVADSWMAKISEFDELNLNIGAEDIRSIMGLPMSEIGRIMFPGFEKEQQERYLKIFEEGENDYLKEHLPPCYEGVTETVKELYGEYPLFIVSNAQVGYIELVMESAGIEEYISDHMCFGDNEEGKDKNIKNIALRNKLDEYYYVGDIQGDYDATIAAGGKFIHAAYGFGEIDADVPAISDIRKLPALMKKLGE